MSSALSGEQRTLLENLVQAGRAWLEDDLATILTGRYGIDPDGRIEAESQLTLTNAEAMVRAELVEILDHLRSDGEDQAGSVERLVREAAFTHLNRLVAVRVAEAIGLLPETIAEGAASRGFRDFSEIAPTIATTEWGRFAVFVRLCADELAADVPALFDPRNPLLELEPSAAALERVVNAIADLDTAIWAAPDALGWVYQFFNTGEERKQMREASVAPRSSRELAVRNQFFTPSYVVDFLVHNGLGAHLVAGFPALADELPMLAHTPTERREIDLNEISVLDPACGSGHFLLGAYDVLENAWMHAGVDPATAAPAIVTSLWGVDIDPRVTQIAQAAVIFRARRHCRDGRLPQPNIICARALPVGREVDELVAALPAHTGRAVRAITDELVEAPILGSLLRVEERLSREARDIFGTGVVEDTLSESIAGETAEIAILGALSAIADATTSSAAQRLFAAEAGDAVRFVEAMNRRYTAVIMNPPFGEPVASTKAYLKAAYPWIPTRDFNLLAAFVGRGIELTEDQVGTCGAITSRAGMFLKTFEDWRRQVLLGYSLDALVDLGFGVMEQALVEAAAYVLRHDKPSGQGTFIRLLKATDRPIALGEAAAAARAGLDDPRVFEIPMSDLHSIPGSPVAYWMGNSIRRLFKDLPVVEGAGAAVRVGLQTGDDFRFVRAFWEVDPERIGHSSEDTRRGCRWVPFAKGGEYSPYWADVHLVVDWGSGGGDLKSFDGSVVRNPQFYFRSGVTWPRRTNSGLGLRLLPAGTAFADKGPAAIPLGDVTPFHLLGWLRSRLVQAMIDAMVAAGEEVSSGGASRSYEVGLVQKLAWLGIPEVGVVTERLALRRARQDEHNETARRYVRPEPLTGTRLDLILEQLDDAKQLDELVLEHARLDDAGRRYLDEEIGPFPLAYAESDAHDDRIADLYERPIVQVIDALIEERGGSRAIANLTFVADRRIEVIAHGLEVSPVSVARVVRERQLNEPGAIDDRAFRLISYLVGLSFGRWDVRLGRQPEVASVPKSMLDSPARYAPGALLDEAGRPFGAPPAEYAVAFPAAGVLVDQAGHPFDVTAAVSTAAIALWDSEQPLAAVLGVLQKKGTVAGYLRSEFFKRHVTMYSMSRRRAPIYWQLQVPSKSWGVWLYYPRLSREMLFAVAKEAEQRQRLAQQQIAHLQREAETGGGGRKSSELSAELDTERELAVELEAFRVEADRIANLGWEPDLDDGAVLNAAPLADLIPGWKDAAVYREDLRAGKYAWATVAQFADRL
jgi:hypothetical protein